MIINGIQGTAEGFNPDRDELKAYVDVVKARVENVSVIHVKLRDDGEVDVNYTARNQPFERIRRITGKEIAVRRQAV